MKFTDYIESRFVSSNLAIRKKPTTGQMGQNEGILGLMWITVKLLAIYHLFVIVGHYIASHLGLAQLPKKAENVAMDARLDEMNKQAEAKKISDSIMKQATQARAEQGLDSKGTA